MIAQWRLFLAALRSFTRLPVSAGTMATLPAEASARFLPLVGVVVGIIGGAIYWLSAQFWPTSVAVIVSMLATVLITGGAHEHGLVETITKLRAASNPKRVLESQWDSATHSFSVLAILFVVFIKYNTLMALSAANLSFALPANTALTLLLIAGHGASRALLVSVITPDVQSPSQRVSMAELSFALVTGFVPAAILGLPGLIGLVAAIVMRMVLVAYVKHRIKTAESACFGATQQLTEACFYLGALATWTYV